jgi:hypothetical protein
MLALSSGVEVEAVRPWLMAICRNVCLDRLRSARRRPAVSLDSEDVSEPAAAPVDQDKHPEHSVSDVFGTHPRAAMVFEGDYIRSFLPAAYRPSQARFFTFPTQASSAQAPIEVGGNVAALLSTRRRASACCVSSRRPRPQRCRHAAAASSPPNHKLPLSDYPDAISRQLAVRVANAPAVGFGISDQEPPAFGSDPAQGMGAIFQQFLAHPDNIDGITRQLQAGATAAAACERAVGGNC